MLKSFIALSSLFIASATFAQTNPLSVHVLNLETGLPSSQVEVVLEKNTNNQWIKLNEQVTDSSGRITALYPENKKLEQGIYKVTFKTEDWANSNMRCDSLKSLMIINKLSKFL